MMEPFEPIAEWSAVILELIGIALILLVSVIALSSGLLNLARKKPFHKVVGEVRERLGQGILLGLEFLVGADIIHTVAVELTLRNTGILAIVVLIRTFLSFTLEAELTGKWPWQGNRTIEDEKPAR